MHIFVRLAVIILIPLLISCRRNKKKTETKSDPIFVFVSVFFVPLGTYYIFYNREINICCGNKRFNTSSAVEPLALTKRKTQLAVTPSH